MRYDRRVETLPKLWSWFKAGSWSTRWKVLLMFINAIPNLTYPAGLSAYWDVIEQEGSESVLNRANLWREIWHGLGGIATGAVGIHPAVICLVILGKEIYEGISERNFTVKSLVDVAAWTAGAWIGSLIPWAQ